MYICSDSCSIQLVQTIGLKVIRLKPDQPDQWCQPCRLKASGNITAKTLHTGEYKYSYMEVLSLRVLLQMSELEDMWMLLLEVPIVVQWPTGAICGHNLMRSWVQTQGFLGARGDIALLGCFSENRVFNTWWCGAMMYMYIYPCNNVNSYMYTRWETIPYLQLVHFR